MPDHPTLREAIRQAFGSGRDALATAERLLGESIRPPIPPHEHPDDEGEQDEGDNPEPGHLEG